MLFEKHEAKAVYDEIHKDLAHSYALLREGISAAGHLEVISEQVDILWSLIDSLYERVDELENYENQAI